MSQFNLRSTGIVVAVMAGLTLPASAASAAELPVPLPCVQGVTCEEPAPKPAVVCPNGDLRPAAGNLRKVRRATLCLVNHERTERGLGKLRASRPLQRVATRYARSMVARSFFDHVSPTGSTFVERIEASTYLADAERYEVGENLAWGSGALATPRRIVRSWMESPGHRANILDRDYRDLGVGVALGVPVTDAGSGATYVNEFGKRA